MNALDFILLIPLLFMAYRGFSKGLIISLATLVALILGIWAGIRFNELAAGFVGQIIHTDARFLPAITFTVIFILILVIVHLLGKMLEKLVDLIALGWINKLLGGLFGIFKAALLLSVLLYIISIFDPHEKLITATTKENSFLYRPVASLVPRMLTLFKLDTGKWNLYPNSCHSWQHFSFHIFQHSSPTRGDIAYPVGQVVFVDGGNRVTAADQAVGSFLGDVSNGFCNKAGSILEVWHLKNTHRAVPENGG